MDRIFYDNTIGSYLWVLGVILFVVVINQLISKYLAHLVCRIFKKIWVDFDEERFLSLIVRPLGIFLIISVSIAVVY
nr:hypothetical protein [Flavisolibacter sp.]